MSKTWGFFLVAQDMVLSHRAKFQLIINFFQVKAISTGLLHRISIFVLGCLLGPFVKLLKMFRLNFFNCWLLQLSRLLLQ